MGRDLVCCTASADNVRHTLHGSNLKRGREAKKASRGATQPKCSPLRAWAAWAAAVCCCCSRPCPPCRPWPPPPPPPGACPASTCASPPRASPPAKAGVLSSGGSSVTARVPSIAEVGHRLKCRTRPVARPADMLVQHYASRPGKRAWRMDGALCANGPMCMARWVQTAHPCVSAWSATNARGSEPWGGHPWACGPMTSTRKRTSSSCPCALAAA